METPSSTRRVTRSQTLASLSNSNNIPRKKEGTEKGFSKTKQRTSKKEPSAMIDITNDSPIVGLARRNLVTPVSSVAKQRNRRTPGSGEALLRGQVKTLLQKDEEEAVNSKFLLETDGDCPLGMDLKAFLNCPSGLLAPTPANTPQVLNFSSAVDGLESCSVLLSPIQDLFNISQVGNEKKRGESDLMISRSLLLDFSEKSDTASECSSVVTLQGVGEGVETESQGKPGPLEDDDASIWSIQVNASTRDEHEDEEDVYDVESADCDVYAEDEDYGEEEESDLLSLDALCEEMSMISVNGAQFTGKHTRFVYNSDDELVEEFEECKAEDYSVLRLRGLTSPKGKHGEEQ